MKKKFIFGMFAAATMLFATSCSNDELDGVRSGKESVVSFTLEQPGISTRTYSDGLKATTLTYAVYDATTKEFVTKSEDEVTFVNKTATVNLRLVTGKTYNILFWADAENAPYTFDENAQTITVDYTNVASQDENRDAFFAVVEGLLVDGAISKVITLYRPFAQLNIGTTDAEEDAVKTYAPTQSSVTVKNVYNTLNLFSGEVTNEVALTYAMANIPGEGETFPVANVKYLSMNYLLVSKDKELVDVEFTVTNGSHEITREYGSVYVQRNYRTNIYGKLLTDPAVFTINIDEEYEKPDYEYLVVEPIDLSIDPVTGKMETSNGYIVSEAGSYGFPATHRGNETTPSISKESISSVEVLWESFGTSEAINAGDLISKVSYKDGKVNFEATDRKGNAVIAVKDANGNIIWSWHIWMTDMPQDQVYNNNAGIMMDRNLGATSATYTTSTDVIKTHGLLYQWGRRDPFLGGGKISSSTTTSKAQSTLSWPTAVESSDTTGTIGYAIANPTTFIFHNGDNSDWLNNSDNDLWSSEKTIYDPCPSGYRVPDGGRNGIWYLGMDNGTYASGIGGFKFKIADDKEAWYPSTGYIYDSTLSMRHVGSVAFYWSCTKNSDDTISRLYLYGQEYYSRNYANDKSRWRSNPIRCQKIE